MASYVLVWRVHWVILEVQKPQENEFVRQLNAASLLWYPFSKAGLSSEEAASFHWCLTFRGTKVRSEDSVSCWAPSAECSESSVLSEHANTCTEALVLNRRHYFQALFPPLFPSQITLVLPPANTAHHENSSLARHQFTVGAAGAQSNTCFRARRMLLSSGTDCHVLANVRVECSLARSDFVKLRLSQERFVPDVAQCERSGEINVSVGLLLSSFHNLSGFWHVQGLEY